MTRLRYALRVNGRAVIASGLLSVVPPLSARGDWCTRCLQPGHTASSCPRPWPAAQPSLDRPVTVG